MWLRLNVLLLVALVLSALAQVRQSYEHRRTFAAFERSKFEARKLEADLAHLQAERENEATNLRVEQLARERLLMRPISPAVTLATASSPAASAASQP
ncbi:cell division protein FtsL [Inhella gelatinilytica]|uniref:Cell division protein FtsL n=1 Tax=Inhella gelatinilytica TaxID=2795030 RepID=A0A931IUF4_9BURK|nr:cell division protein FtsL [Inhella gelatinilytica]MBH9552354.1 cell division protein FtsL [Inhella gelatinilytica]